MKPFQITSRIGIAVWRSAVCILFVIIASSAYAAQVTLSWNPNTESDLAGYRIHYGTARGSYSAPIDVRNVTVYTLIGLAPEQTYYFAATAYDSSGSESGYSNEVSFTTSAFKGLPWLQLLLQEEE